MVPSVTCERRPKTYGYPEEGYHPAVHVSGQSYPLNVTQRFHSLIRNIGAHPGLDDLEGT